MPTLDGWRAIAICSVILHHDSFHPDTGWLYQHGQYGVDLFFAISGVLICSRLLEEESAFGKISLRGFYIRRAFRILPPAFAFLIVVGLLGLLSVLQVGWKECLASAFFLRNYTFLLGGADPYFTGHFWSLAVEEHFYFILPSLLFVTGKKWRLPALCLLILVVIAHRFMVLQHRQWDHVRFHTDVRLDALLIPASFAVMLQSHRVRRLARRWLRFWPFVLLAVLMLITIMPEGFWLATSLAFLFPLVILGSLLNPKGIASFLELAPLRYVGRISYSLYLWQQVFFVGHFYSHYPLGWLQSTALRFVGVVGMASCSYQFLERPAMRIGKRLAPPATPGRI